MTDLSFNLNAAVNFISQTCHLLSKSPTFSFSYACTRTYFTSFFFPISDDCTVIPSGYRSTET